MFFPEILYFPIFPKKEIFGREGKNRLSLRPFFNLDISKIGNYAGEN
jgi:hypothetical protein